MPAAGAVTTASVMSLWMVAICASMPSTRAAAASISCGRAPALSRARVSCGCLGAILGAADAGDRHVAPGHGVVALLDGTGAGAQQVLEALDVGRGGAGIGLRGVDVGLRRLGLGLGLADVFGTRAGLEQRELRGGLAALGGGAAQGERGVGGVDTRDRIAGGDAVSLVDAHLEEPPADLGGDAHVGCLDVARRAGRGQIRRGVARRQDERQDDQVPGTRDCAHEIFPSSCARASCWMWRTISSTRRAADPSVPRRSRRRRRRAVAK